MLRKLLIILFWFLSVMSGAIVLSPSFGYIQEPEVIFKKVLNFFIKGVEYDTLEAPSLPIVIPKKVEPKVSAKEPLSVNKRTISVARKKKGKVVTPGPLRVSTLPSVISPTPKQTLSILGVIQYTNNARLVNKLVPLTGNELLNRNAQIKLNDMFDKQYFDHVSPTGVGPADLAKKVNYLFVIVGENLALGNFDGDQALVTAWMNSPGHRANILDTRFQEIGVAVGKGIYQGRETWLAVQSFGRPLSSCPSVSIELKAIIDADTIMSTHLHAQLEEKKRIIDGTNKSDRQYNVLIREFNALIPEYNLLIEKNFANTVRYNNGVTIFNTCINNNS